ncbi:MAG: DUF1365 domain-containing protein [Betaproteobacteria bacterium]|nr:MAG: DUF1365 domain-containing protein [Betaproteobacteria bacterium]
MSRAAIIVGEVTHERERPAKHAFTYPLFCVRLPLQELSAINQVLPVNRSGLTSFQERDHGMRDGSSLLAWIRRVLTEHDLIVADTPIDVELVTFPRILGYVFNPVSFWICRDTEKHVLAVLVEVRNTFGQGHSYLLTPTGKLGLVSGETLFATKQLHVSPFNQVVGSYAFRFNFAPEQWLARIDYDDGKGHLLHTHISGRAQPLSKSNLRAALIRFPLQSVAVVARIHWQALRLAIKRVPFYGKLTSRMTGISRS